MKKHSSSDPRSIRTLCHVSCLAFVFMIEVVLSGRTVIAMQAAPSSVPLKPTLTPADYGQWESLAGNGILTPDGRWLAYGLRRVNRERELRVRQLDGETEHAFAQGANPIFSQDGAWLAWTISLTEEEQERLTEQEKPVRQSAGLLDLESGEERTFDDVQRHAFDETGRFLVLLGYAPDEPKGKGADLRLLELESGIETTFGNVAEFAWNESGSMLALLIMTGADQSNGVQVFDAANGRLRGLDSTPSAYQGLAWREESSDLAVLRSIEPASEEESTYLIRAWRGLDGDDFTRHELDGETEGIDEAHEVVRHGNVSWSDDGTMIAFGVRPIEDEDDKEEKEADSEETEADDDTEEEDKDKAKKDKGDDTDLPGLQIWHSDDVRIIPGQMASKERDARRVLRSVWHLVEDRVVTIGSDLMARMELLEGWRHAIERITSPYPWEEKFGRPYHEAWVIDVTTGERERMHEKVRYSWGSAGGHYLLTFDGEHYSATDLRTGDRVNLTRDLPTTFANTEYDTPTDILPPHGVGGWLADDEAVLLYDRFDVWRIAPDGSGARRLTRGAGNEVIHRLADLDPEEEAYDADRSLYFHTRGEWTERQGYVRLQPGSDTPEVLMSLDKRTSGLTKAEEAEVYLYSVQSREDSPDYFVAGPDLASPRQMSMTNPFQEDFAWTRSQLVEFESESGRRLQAGLLFPANFDPAKRYPMIVYTYELLTPRIHSYEVPDERRYYNYIAWTQQGYFVLLPDIVYRAGDPGVSALEAVRPAVAKIVELGYADAERVGLIGHSWGGYQAAYLPTRTDIFAASVAGAPLTDFVSFMGQIHWNPGMAELSHWETGQARMAVPYWEDPEAHLRNSPLHRVHEMTTPMLMVHGNKDGVVEFFQSTVFYNFARRAEKQMVLLVYEGEDHGFRKKANQIDYHRRILEWFGHYLKGEPAPDWITEGVLLKDLEDEKRRIAEMYPDESEDAKDDSPSTQPDDD
ncbi:MAG: prolyl oligopeptidase family serine peptidase [Planctomycetota bacterium]|nr:prolyl oligopeptidase family serine peptidase [Planctomycetota bacterium]